MIPFMIGKSRNDGTGTLIVPPYGTEVPRPFDVRHIWRPNTGRDIGGQITVGNLEGMDWVYGQTGNIVATFYNLYDPRYPRVWVSLLDPYLSDLYWYEATMLEPHVERGAGRTIQSMIVGFRGMTRYSE